MNAIGRVLQDYLESRAEEAYMLRMQLKAKQEALKEAVCQKILSMYGEDFLAELFSYYSGEVFEDDTLRIRIQLPDIEHFNIMVTEDERANFEIKPDRSSGYPIRFFSLTAFPEMYFLLKELYIQRETAEVESNIWLGDNLRSKEEDDKSVL